MIGFLRRWTKNTAFLNWIHLQRKVNMSPRVDTVFHQMHFYIGQIFPLQPVSLQCLTPSLSLPPPSVYISNRVELFQCITLQSQAGDGRAPPMPLCQTTKAASCFENFPHHANWQRHAFQKPTANLLIIIYLQRPSGCKSCKNHTWYVCSLSRSLSAVLPPSSLVE